LVVGKLTANVSDSALFFSGFLDGNQKTKFFKTIVFTMLAVGTLSVYDHSNVSHL
jgi:hypothetical protein